jgi:hypothetical protein
MTDEGIKLLVQLLQTVADDNSGRKETLNGPGSRRTPILVARRYTSACALRRSTRVEWLAK